MFKPRKTAPTKALGWPENPKDWKDRPLEFRVWSNDPAFAEDPKPWKCVAAFQYLQEALDYVAYCQDRGGDVVFQSPADCRTVKATDRRVVYRVVYKPETCEVK